MNNTTENPNIYKALAFIGTNEGGHILVGERFQLIPTSNPDMIIIQPLVWGRPLFAVTPQNIKDKYI